MKHEQTGVSASSAKATRVWRPTGTALAYRFPLVVVLVAPPLVVGAAPWEATSVRLVLAVCQLAILRRLVSDARRYLAINGDSVRFTSWFSVCSVSRPEFDPIPVGETFGPNGGFHVRIGSRPEGRPGARLRRRWVSVAELMGTPMSLSMVRALSDWKVGGPEAVRDADHPGSIGCDWYWRTSRWRLVGATAFPAATLVASTLWAGSSPATSSGVVRGLAVVAALLAVSWSVGAGMAYVLVDGDRLVSGGWGTRIVLQRAEIKSIVLGSPVAGLGPIRIECLRSGAARVRPTRLWAAALMTPTSRQELEAVLRSWLAAGRSTGAEHS